MATVTAQANGIGSTGDLWSVNTGTKYAAVNLPDDDGTTRIANSSAGQIQSFTCSPGTIAVGDTVTQVKLYFRAIGIDGSNNGSVYLGYSFNKTPAGTQSGESSSITITRTAYADYSYTHSGLSAAWNGGCEFYVKKNEWYGVRATTFYIEITYTPAATAKPAVYYAMMNTN